MIFTTAARRVPAPPAWFSSGPLRAISTVISRLLSEEILVGAWPRFALALMSDPRYGIERALTGDAARAEVASLIARLDQAIVAPADLSIWTQSLTSIGDVQRAQMADDDPTANDYAASGADAIAQVFVAVRLGRDAVEVVEKATKAASYATATYAAEEARRAGTAGATAHVNGMRSHQTWQLHKLAQIITDAQDREHTDALFKHERAIAHDE